MRFSGPGGLNIPSSFAMIRSTSSSHRSSLLRDQHRSQIQILTVALIVVLLPLILPFPLSNCKSDGDRFSDVRSEILDFLEEENIPSVSVAVAEHGRIVWEESFGWANREKKVKATTQTM
jgi:CubicO group peptidase (beta-lactamase class C family)